MSDIEDVFVAIFVILLSLIIYGGIPLAFIYLVIRVVKFAWFGHW